MQLRVEIGMPAIQDVATGHQDRITHLRMGEARLEARHVEGREIRPRCHRGGGARADNVWDEA